MKEKHPHIATIVKVLYRLFIGIAAFIVGILLLLVLVLRVPAIQNYLTDKAENYIEKKINTKFNIENIYINFPTVVNLKGIYLEGQTKDTLAYIGQIKTRVDLWKLTNQKIEVNSLDLENVTGNIFRHPNDSNFNFQFIIDAFSSGEPKPQDTTSSPWEFSIEKVHLRKINFHFNDSLSQNYNSLLLGELEAKINSLDLDSLSFDVDEIDLRDTHYVMHSLAVSGSEDSEEDTTEAISLNINANKIIIEKVTSAIYLPELNMNGRVGEFEMNNGEFSLLDQMVSVEEVELNNSEYTLQTLDTATTESKEQPNEESKPWTAKVDHADFENNAFHMAVANAPEIRGFDPNDIDIAGISGEVENAYYQGEKVSGNVLSFVFVDKNDFSVKEFSTDFSYDGQKIATKNLHLRTNYSEIEGDVDFYIESFLDTTSRQTKNKSIIDIRKANIHPQDIFYFVPDMRDQLPIRQEIKMQLNAEGELANLNVKSFRLALDSILLTASGGINGLPDVSTLSVDDMNMNLRADLSSIKRIAPDTLIPSGIQLPEKMNLSVMLNGSLRNMENEIDLKTSFGNLKGKGTLQYDTLNNYLSTDYNLNTRSFYLDKMLDNPQLGQVTADINVNADRTKVSSPEFQIKATIDSVDYNNYTYKNLSIDGMVHEALFDGEISLEDDAIGFDYTGKAGLANNEIILDFKIDITKTNLQTLNFSTAPFIFQGEVFSDITIDSLNRLNGALSLHSIEIIKNGVFYPIDSLYFNAVNEENETTLELRSDILQADLEGNIDLLKIPTVLNHHIQSYFSDSLKTVNSADTISQEFTISVELLREQFLTEVLVPGLEELDISILEGYFDGENDEMIFTFTIPTMTYKGNHFKGLDFNISSDKNDLKATVAFNQYNNSFLTIDSLRFLARAKNDQLNMQLSIPENKRKKLNIAGSLYQKDSVYRFSFDPDSLILNFQPWEIPEGNYLAFGQGLEANQISLTRNNKRLGLETRVNENQDSILSIQFEEFSLQSLAGSFTEDTIATGTVNGNFNLITSSPNLAFNTELNINNLHIKNQEIGRLTLKNSYSEADNVNNLSLRLSGGENDLEINGELTDADSLQYDLDVNLTNLDLKDIQPFVSQSINELSGSAKGDFTVRSEGAVPSINGEFSLHEVKIVPALLGTSFTIPNETITFKDGDILFNNFTILDKDNNEAVLDGKISSQNFTNYRYNLNLNLDNYLLVNTGEDDSDLFYGKLILDVDADISGTEQRYNINANVNVEENTALTVVVPESSTSVASREGIVEFVDKSRLDDEFYKILEEQQKDTSEMVIKGLNLTTNLSVDEGTKFSLIVDPTTGDRLDLRGRGDFSFSIPPTGNMSLTGRYEVNDGTYKLNFYGLVKREFQIVEGSSVVWTGDIMDARLDLTARYQLETSPPVLSINERIPFYVNMMIAGELLHPELNFELSMPQNTRDRYPQVYTSLQDINSQESELNQQVFSLIVFNNFMLPDRPSTGASTLVSNTARSSLSNILTQQLNRLTGGINAVNLDLNLDSYTIGQQENREARTELEVGLSKSLFDDRLLIRVSGNVRMDERRKEQSSVSDYAGDIMIEYKLTEAGTWRLQAFSTEEYDALSAGEITRTGVGVIYMKDYDSIKELFSGSSKEDNEQNDKK